MKNQDNIHQDLIKRSEYEKSYSKLGSDEDIMSIAEEGMLDYFEQLESSEGQ